MSALASLAQDARFALRQLVRRPAFTVVALAVIAAGIAVNATSFAFLSAVYARTLPVRDASRLSAIRALDARTGRDQRIAPAAYAHLRAHATTLAGVAAQDWAWTWLADGERSVEWRVGRVSPDYFGVLGVEPRVGRFFADGDGPAVVLSHAAWRRTFDADPEVLGRSLRLNREAYTVIGVAPDGFEGFWAGDALDAWSVSDAPGGQVVGRLAPGRSVSDARAEVALLVRHAATAAGADEPPATVVEPLRGVEPEFRQSLALLPGLLAAITATVLVVACANLAGLLLARADSRRSEMATRFALGASRARVIRQLLTESVLLALAGGALGLLLAVAGCRAFETFAGSELRRTRLLLDGGVVEASIVLAALTGIAFGLVPALQATRTDLRPASARRITGAWLVGIQLALCLVLLFSSALLARSLRALDTRKGFEPARIAQFRLRPSRLGYDLERARAYQHELLRRLTAAPGVAGATLARVPPDRGWCCAVPVARPDGPTFEVDQNEIVPGYLELMGIRVLRGRDFVDGDRETAIVDASLAERLWPGQDPVGRELRVEGQPHRVVGVAAAIHPLKARELAYPYLYLPLWGRDARDARVFVRTTGPAGPWMAALRREVLTADPEVHVGQDGTLAERMAETHQRERLVAATVRLGGTCALLLGALGLYGLMAFQVARRTREIGVRMALGARPGQVAAWTLRWAARATAAGLAAGLVGAWAAARALEGLLFGVSPRDPASLAIAGLTLAAAALAASVLPAWRAARVDPAIALRHD